MLFFTKLCRVLRALYSQLLKWPPRITGQLLLQSLVSTGEVEVKWLYRDTCFHLGAISFIYGEGKVTTKLGSLLFACCRRQNPAQGRQLFMEECTLLGH